jgi:hypothetical protein
VYSEVGKNEWQAELIDWFPVVVRNKNYEGFREPPEPFVIDRDRVPENLLKALKWT